MGKNVVQFAVTYPGYYGGRIPESDVETGGVFIWENEAQLFEALHKYGCLRLCNGFTQSTI